MENSREYLIYTVDVTSFCANTLAKAMPILKTGWREVDQAEKIGQLNAQQGHRTASAYPTRLRQSRGDISPANLVAGG